ncbi:hypothetical protein [Sabulibacter ruber]|uniref:hypothetical protein n=1 Tax=Sabulibacter ruber TaxID=2811901 RepID=UPI001A971F42|nr:hypothetical protein [Sabulibacter ruber]
MLTYNGQKHAFTVTMDADSVRPSEHPGWVYVNGQIVQASTVPVPEHLYQDTLSEKRQQEILLGYINYEMEYFKKELKIKYKDLDIHPGTLEGAPVVFWLFSMPKGDDIRKQIYVTRLCFNQALSLNIPLRQEEDMKESLRLLTNLMKTVKVYDQPLDLNQLYKELN